MYASAFSNGVAGLNIRSVAVRILSIFLFTFFVNTAFAIDILTWKTEYESDEDVWIELKDKPNNIQDWIGVYPVGSSNDWGNVVSWVWANDTSQTSVDPGDWYKFEDTTGEHFGEEGNYTNYQVALPPGEYEARFFLNNSYVVEAKTAAFTVKAESTVQLILDKQTYASNDTVQVSYSGMSGERDDWLAIYEKGDSTAWGNVKAWAWSDGETNGSLSLSFENLAAGDYEVRVFFNNSFTVETAKSFNIVVKEFGARSVESTPLGNGTLFASPNGNGEACSARTPCHIQTAVDKLKAGDVLFLKGGDYALPSGINITASGTKDNPITIESYPGELAILDGLMVEPEDIIATPNVQPRPGLWVHTGNNYVSIRKLVVKNMRDAGIKLDSHHNTVEGCVVHGNHYNGIHITDGEKQYNAPYVNGFNTIRDNIVYDNSDAGLPSGLVAGASYNNGNNSDGISVSSSRNNVITYNTIYDNSDDGIDTWRSNYSYVAYNFSYDNGKGDGNGNGIKTGSDVDTVTGLVAKVEHNVSYNNKSRGFNYNSGLGAIYRYNTAYDNGTVGFKTGDDTVVEYNISSSSNGDSQTETKAGHVMNSWQEDQQVFFMSTDQDSAEFLKPIGGSVFEEMGVYAQ